MPVRIFTEPNLFALEQDRFLIVFIDFRQREQTALIVDIGQSRRIADNALATRYAPALAEPTGTVLVGIIAAAPNQRQNAFKSKVCLPGQELQPVDRIDRPAQRQSRLTGEADVLVEAFAELAVHMEEIAGTHDLVLMDAHRRAVLLGPGLGPDRAGDDPFAHPGLVAEGAGGGGGIVYECRFAVEADLFGGFLCGAEVGGEGEGDGGNDPGDEAEVGDDGDDGISAVATGDFLDRHGKLFFSYEG